MLGLLILSVLQKRGCAEICPDGTLQSITLHTSNVTGNVIQGVLVSGKGTRFILANTEQLHTKIHEMSERIRHLEEALEALHSQHSTETHPLLRSEYMGIKSTMGLYGGIQAGTDTSSTPSENGHDYESKSGQMEMDIRGPNQEIRKTIQQVRPILASHRGCTYVFVLPVQGAAGESRCTI